jgi:hypothetical protein
MPTWLRQFGAAVVILFLASTTQAGTVQATVTSFSNVNSIKFKINDGTGTPATIVYGRAGYSNWDQTPTGPGTNSSELPNNFRSFCIELTPVGKDIINGGTYTFTIASLESAPVKDAAGGTGMGSDRADAIRRLFHGAYNDNLSLVDAAAFQLAIWRLEYDYDGSMTAAQIKDFNSGNFRAVSYASTQGLSDQSIAQAQTWLEAVLLKSGDFATPDFGVVALTNPDRQDQVTRTPEPASLTLGAIGLGAMFVYRTYRRKKHS